MNRGSFFIFRFKLAASLCLMTVCLLFVGGCRLPESMAPKITQMLFKGWRSINTTTQVMEIWPNITDLPDERYKMKYRDARLGTSEYGIRHDVLEPAEFTGYSVGKQKRTVWMNLAKNKGTMVLSGWRPYSAERDLELLTRVIRENLRIMEFSMSRTKWDDHMAVEISATPDPWTDPYYFKSVTITDLSSRAIMQAQEYDKKGVKRQKWRMVDYKTNVPQEPGIYIEPKQTQGVPYFHIDLSKGAEWKNGLIESIQPVVHPTAKATHKLHNTDFGPVVVSDYGDGLNEMLLIQYPKSAPDFHPPWSRKVRLKNRTVRVALIASIIFISFHEENHRGLLLVQDNIHTALHLLEEMK